MATAKLAIHLVRAFHIRDPTPWREADRAPIRSSRQNPIVSAEHEEDHRGGFDPGVARASDHTSDVPAVSRATSAPIVAVYELALWFERKGLTERERHGHRWDVSVAGLEVSMVPAVHTQQRRRERDQRVSRSAGRLRRAHGGRAERFTSPATPTCSATCGSSPRCMRRKIGFLPIGDHFTMDPAAQPCAATSARRPPDRADALRNVPCA